MPNKLWQEVEDIVKEEAKNNIPKASRKKNAKCLSKEVINIADRRRESKTKGTSREDIKRLNADFQTTRKDIDEYFKET